MRPSVIWTAIVLITLGLFGLLNPPSSALSAAPDTAEPTGAPVYQMTITGAIDLGLVPYLERVLDEAAQEGAAAVIIVIDTPGGRLDAVIELRDSLLKAKVPTISLVDTLALSAGALIAIATDEIYMTPGSVLGAATPVLGGTGEVADAKTISAVKAMFESTAEQTGRDPQVAGAMVDTSVDIPGLTEPEELLTLTVNEALEYGYAEAVVDGLDELLVALEFETNPLVVRDPGITERLVRIITSPAITGLLLLGGVILIFGDLLSTGTGIGVVLGGVLLGLFFWGHLLAGLAGWEDLALIVLGLILIGVEIFVLPGFGIAGILGAISVGVGTFLAMINRDFSLVRTEDLVRAGITLLLVVIGASLAIIAILSMVSHGGATRRLVLQSQLGSGTGHGDIDQPNDAGGRSSAGRARRGSGRLLRFFGGDVNLPHHHEDAHHRQPDKGSDQRDTSPGGQ
jgi:membrane-bound serine protease (ClpP class)